MKDEKNKHDEELDCQVTVYDGAHNTCDMVEEESTIKDKVQNEYDI